MCIRDRLYDGHHTFYTIMGDDIVEVTHKRISDYQSFLKANSFNDDDYAWGKFDLWVKFDKLSIFN